MRPFTLQPHLACPRLHRRRRADRALVLRIWDLFRIRRQREKKMMMRLVIRGSFSSCIVWAVSVAALPTETNLHRGTHDDCQNQHQGRHEARRRPEATVSVPQYSHRPLSSDPRREGAVVVYEPGPAGVFVRKVTVSFSRPKQDVLEWNVIAGSHIRAKRKIASDGSKTMIPQKKLSEGNKAVRC